VIVNSASLRICDLRQATAGPSLSHPHRSAGRTPIVLITENDRYAISAVGGSLRVWDIASGRCVVVSSEAVEIVQLNAMGDHVAAVDIDGNALFATLKNVERGPSILTAGYGSMTPCPMCGKSLDT